MGWFDDYFGNNTQAPNTTGSNQSHQSAYQQQGAQQANGLTHQQYNQQTQAAQQGLGAWLPQGTQMQNSAMNNNTIGRAITYSGSQELMPAETRELMGRWLKIDPVAREAYLNMMRAEDVKRQLYGSTLFWPAKMDMSLQELEQAHITDVADKVLLECLSE